MVAQERRSRRAAARLEQRQMAMAEDAAKKASPALVAAAGSEPHTCPAEECVGSSAPAAKDADTGADPQSLLLQVPSPVRRRRLQAAKGPAPWASSPDKSANHVAGPSYRDQLRNNGHSALQRTRGNDVIPSPVTVQLFPFLGDAKPTIVVPSASASVSQSQPYSMPSFQQQAPTQGYYYQPVYFQPTCYVAQAPAVVGCPTGDALTPMFAPCDNPSAGAGRGRGFEMNSEQLEAMIRHSREDVYED